MRVRCEGQGRDLVAELALLSDLERGRVLDALSPEQRIELHERWAAWAFASQRAPVGDWHIWLIRAGRGFGKTRAGAEWVSEFARANGDARIALVGANAADVRRVMIEGGSGLIAVARGGEPVRWLPSKGELHFASGAVAYAYAAEAPEALRGPEHHIAWCDELAKWRGRAGEMAWDNLMLGLRLGERPQVLVTTTPRATPLMKRLDEPKLAGLVAKGAVTGLSFGYRARQARRGGVRELIALDLIEVSLVAQPMQRLARIHAVRATP